MRSHWQTILDLRSRQHASNALVAVAVSALGLGVAGCSGDDENEPNLAGNTPSAAYLLSVATRDPDSASSIDYHWILDDLEVQTLSLSDALETFNASSLVYEGQVFIFEGDASTLTRFDVDVNNRLVPGPVIGFSGTGGGIFGARLTTVVSANQAFTMDDPVTTIVEWNPTTMEIVSANEFPDFSRNGVPSLGSEIYQVGDELVVPITWLNLTTFEALETIAFARMPLDDPSQVTLEEQAAQEGCGLSWNTALTPDGSVVFAADQYIGAGAFYAGITGSCFYRTTPGLARFDESFRFDLSDVTDEQLLTVTVTNETLWFTTMDESGATFDRTDPGTYFSGQYCSLWSGSLDEPSTFQKRPDAQFESGECGVPVYTIDGSVFKSAGRNDFNDVQQLEIMRLTDSGLEPTISVEGSFMLTFDRIR